MPLNKLVRGLTFFSLCICYHEVKGMEPGELLLLHNGLLKVLHTDVDAIHRKGGELKCRLELVVN